MWTDVKVSFQFKPNAETEGKLYTLTKNQNQSQEKLQKNNEEEKKERLPCAINFTCYKHSGVFCIHLKILYTLCPT